MEGNIVIGSLYQNSEGLPLEDLKFKINVNGIKREIKAFSNFWVETRFHSRFPGLPKAGNIEEQQWLDSMNWFNKELEWMLNLEYFRFWSNIVYDTGCMDSLVSFLQEAAPFFSPFKHDNKEIVEAYATAYKNVLQIFCRIITNKENESCWMGKDFLGNLLYDYSLITIPILWDLTALYGILNVSVLTRFMDTVFKLQPKYQDDLKIAYLFLKDKVFSTIENQSGVFTETSTNHMGEQINLYPSAAESALADLAWHLLDCVATMRHFFEVYPPSKLICRNLKMCSSLAQLYDNCIPTLFNKLIENNNSNVVNNARAELLECYTLILNTCMEQVLADISKAIGAADEFLEIISETLHVLHNQKAFVEDLLSKQPLQNDLELLRQSCKDLDPVKCDFILQSLMSSVDDSIDKKFEIQSFNLCDKTTQNHFNDYISDEEGACAPRVALSSEVNVKNTISEVSDVFPDLGSGYIKRLLDYFGTSVQVISALLEDNIPPELNSLDKSEPFIPPDPLEELHEKLGDTHLNVFDGDNYDMRIRDVPIEHWQKKHKRGPKNLNDLLNDKSHIKEMKTKYEEYNLVYDNIYDDEYDDTYEGPSKPPAEDSDSDSRRPNEVPRVLYKPRSNDNASEEEDEDVGDASSGPPTKFQPFCENPEVIRARREAQRNSKIPNRDVVGKAKGQGQDKEVLINRDKKNTNKSTRANHNRRQGAQWKKSRGMMPF